MLAAISLKLQILLWAVIFFEFPAQSSSRQGDDCTAPIINSLMQPVEESPDLGSVLRSAIQNNSGSQCWNNLSRPTGRSYKLEQLCSKRHRRVICWPHWPENIGLIGAEIGRWEASIPNSIPRVLLTRKPKEDQLELQLKDQQYIAQEDDPQLKVADDVSSSNRELHFSN